ncbi:MAG: translation initiation factor, partial [Candidatus Obscuribacterales bacterium]|nr:translation initiation factor [Candidatus Obscuribacterales bacterium]
ANACLCISPKVPDNKKKKPDPIRISLERKGRGGKAVTTASGFTLEESKLEELLTSLKKLCGSGGTIKDGQIEIQGDQRVRLISELEKLGYKCKKVGG